MSYLDHPRLTLAGSFKTDPSTLNNDIGNFAHAAASSPELCHSLFNPYGKNYFSLNDCTVRSCSTAEGVVQTTVKSDPLIGTTVTFVTWDDGLPEGVYSTAKLVDLDPLNQTVSTVYGARIRIGDERASVTGRFEPSGVRDAWFGRAPVGGDASASATWQTVLKDLKWEGEIDSSPMLKSLKLVSPDLLSLKLTMDAFQSDPNAADFLTGRMIGCVGPYVAGEPRQFVAERRLIPQIETPPVGCMAPMMDPKSLLSATDVWCWAAPWKVDAARKVAVIDLGNSLCLDARGPKPIIEQLNAAILPATSDESRVEIAGAIPTDIEQLTMFAGIVEVTLTDEQIELLETRRLGLFLKPDDCRPICAEHECGKYINTDAVFARLNPGESIAIDVYARQFGKPLPQLDVEFECEQCSWTKNANEPLSALFASGKPLVATTDATGRGTLTITQGNRMKFERILSGVE